MFGVIFFTEMVGFEVRILRAIEGEEDVLVLYANCVRYNCAMANGVRGAILTNPDRQHKGNPAYCQLMWPATRIRRVSISFLGILNVGF